MFEGPGISAAPRAVSIDNRHKEETQARRIARVFL
jgi:hypothetical protein